MFKGGAVLQRGVAVSVWGKSSQKNITLKLSEKSQEESAVFVSGAVNSTGDWLVYLPPQPASWNRSLSVTDALGEAGVVVSFGETVLCAGQSNMGMQVRSYLAKMKVFTYWNCLSFRLFTFCLLMCLTG
jgi:hypothetical protein